MVEVHDLRERAAADRAVLSFGPTHHDMPGDHPIPFLAPGENLLAHAHNDWITMQITIS
jgi:hypothetical protein